MNLRNRIVGMLIGDEPRQLTRYLLTGAIAWLVDVGTFALCLESFGVILAQVAARLTGAAVAFLGHKLVVFRQLDYRRSTVMSQIFRYIFLWIIAFCISTLALVVMIEHSPLGPVMSKIVVETGIVLLNYIVMRSLVFRTDAAPGMSE